MVIYSVFLMMLLLAAGSDIARFRIPNALSIGVVLLFIAVALPRFGEIGWASHLGAGMVTLGAGFILFLLGGIGAGDVKLFSATSLWLGLALLPAHLVCTGLLGLVLLIVLLAARWLAWGLRPGASSRPGGTSLPRVLQRRAGVPYGAAIAGSAAVLAAQAPEPLWWL